MKDTVSQEDSTSHITVDSVFWRLRSNQPTRHQLSHSLLDLFTVTHVYLWNNTPAPALLNRVLKAAFKNIKMKGTKPLNRG
jgi:hypothetical protein